MPAPPAYAYNSPQESWTWTPSGGSALPLQSPYGAWNITTIGGSRFALPTYRGQNYTAPYRQGQAGRIKMPDSRTVTLAMWVDGQGQQLSGVFPAPDQRLAFNNNLQQLRATLMQMGATGSAQGLLTRNWYLTQGGTNKLVTASALAELAGSMDLTNNGRTSTAFSVDFLLADPAFYGTSQNHGITTSGTLSPLGELPVGLGYPSTIASFTVSITAACTVDNVTAGVSFTFTPISGSPTYPVVVDVLNQTATDNAGNNWGASLTHSGARSWMVLLPPANAPSGNAITVSAGTATFIFNDVYV